MKRLAATLPILAVFAATVVGQSLPFNYTVETYRNEDGDVMAFAVRLEQPFLAEEFERSNYLRLKSIDTNAFLIYPRETKFRQKHAEFFGRLRGDGTAKLRLAYETVSENLDGSRRVEVREADVEVKLPTDASGAESIYKQWAREQNAHFANLLRYYPEETFFEYVLLQSPDRYGVTPPPFERPTPPPEASEEDVYFLFNGGLAVQQSLQRQALSVGTQQGDLNVHISQLSPPSLRSLDYEPLLQGQRDRDIQPRVHELAKLVPRDQYFLHFNSMASANELMDLSAQWGGSLLRMVTVSARDDHLREKYEDQLCMRRDALTRLFADEVVKELVVTGSDFYIGEGTDVTLILRLKQPEVFRAAADSWLADVKNQHPQLQEREFNYRGHKVAARYTTDRMVSSFVVFADDYAVFSNSHVGIRRVVDTILGILPNLRDAADYQYVSTILPPQDNEQKAYLYCSEDFLKHLVSPAFKIGEKRRKQSLNNLVMLNNASLLYRLEYGKSPTSLTDMVQGRFVNPDKIVCPQGGAYAFDAEHDTSTSSVFNRIKYLTPLVELNVLKVSAQEKAEYERYKRRYEAFWRDFFDPIAVRITVGPGVRLETCVLPLANSSLYGNLRQLVDKSEQPISLANVARSAIASCVLVPGRDRIAAVLQNLPGIQEVLQEDPTLTDLSWLGDQVSLHFCDEDAILEIDPVQLRRKKVFTDVSVLQQSLAASAVAATNLPLYVTVGVEDEDKALRLLEQLTSRVFLNRGTLFQLPTRLDAYRLPDYKDHRVHVLSYQLYAVKVRLHLAVVDGRLVAATAPHVLREVVDAAQHEPPDDAVRAHALLRLDFRAIEKMRDELGIYWAEKSRLASHRNIMPIYNLVTLYGVPIDEVNELSDAKYGVTYYCPDGRYVYDAERDQVYSTVYGSRQQARQDASLREDSSFSRFMNSLNEVVATLRFTDHALITTVEIARDQP